MSPAATRRAYSRSVRTEATASTAPTATTIVAATASGQPKIRDTPRW